jgi:DNA repair exonuclease SbcCD ATPase subunit
LIDYGAKLAKASAKKELLSATIDKKSKDLDKYKEDSIALEEAQVFLQGIAKETQEQIKFNIEDIVNSCLDAVFPGQYVFKVIFEIKRGKTEARLVLMDGENEVEPLQSNGGGLIQILSFALRIALLIISKNRRVLVMDECLNAVSADLEARAYEIVQRISKELGIQVVMVTHREAAIAVADKVITVSKKGDISHVS